MTLIFQVPCDPHHAASRHREPEPLARRLFVVEGPGEHPNDQRLDPGRGGPDLKVHPLAEGDRPEVEFEDDRPAPPPEGRGHRRANAVLFRLPRRDRAE